MKEPGQIVFTRILCGKSLAARILLRWFNAALLVLYPAKAQKFIPSRVLVAGRDNLTNDTPPRIPNLASYRTYINHASSSISPFCCFSEQMQESASDGEWRPSIHNKFLLPLFWVKVEQGGLCFWKCAVMCAGRVRTKSPCLIIKAVSWKKSWSFRAVFPTHIVDENVESLLSFLNELHEFYYILLDRYIHNKADAFRM